MSLNLSLVLLAWVGSQADSQAQGDNLTCTPPALNQTSELTVTLPTPHGSDLAIVGPNGIYHFIAFLQPDEGSAAQPTISSETFQTMTQWQTGVADVMGVSESRPERVFVRAGTYRILVGTGLESDGPEFDGWCEVQYRPQG